MADLPTSYQIAPGQGFTAVDIDYISRARKTFACSHKAPNAWRRMPAPCVGAIQVGEAYVRTRQSWLEWEPVAISCLVNSGVLIEDA